MAQPSPTHSGRKELVSLGQAVRELRLAKGWSLEAFADHVCIDRSYVGGIERGEHNIALVNLIKIASNLGIKVAQKVATFSKKTSTFLST
jgi:transcriptional regulator with XRE-family HTH domain